MYNVINYVSSAVLLWSRLQFRSVVPCFSVSAAKMICCDSLWVIKFLLNLSISLTVRKVKYITYTLHFSLAELTFVVLFLSDEVRCLFQQWSVSIDVILSWQHFHYFGIPYALIFMLVSLFVDSLAHFDFWLQSNTNFHVNLLDFTALSSSDCRN